MSGSDALKVHLTFGFGVVLCALACWFELKRALSGNALSWAYVFEWPLLACFAVYMWSHMLSGHGETSARAEEEVPQVSEEYQGMLTAWQAHQARLAASQAEGETSA